ncbi:MAG TPA: TetR/AcrR family transcriptional regulator [Candidatus Aquabacterium excrementipullorum]|nr:TetR/AcrR family transcriptional regulator [Candidatus Aquabacterium excrementipullorum]
MSAAPSRKELTHERIVQTASQAIRRSGYDGTGVADIMKAAGLTHGGFYAHFPSRTALLAEAADHAGAQALSRLSEVVEQAPEGQGLATLIEHYLSERHCKAVDQGCPMAALGSEMHRQEPAVRQASTGRIKDVIALAEQQVRASMGPEAPNAAVRDAALALVSSLVGSLVLARAVDDPALSKAVLKASRAFLHAHVG